MPKAPAITWPTPGDQGHLRDHRELVKQVHELQDAVYRHEETIAALFSMLHDCVSLLQAIVPSAHQPKLAVAKPNVQVQFGEAMTPTVDEVAKRMKQVLDAMKKSGLA